MSIRILMVKKISEEHVMGKAERCRIIEVLANYYRLDLPNKNKKGDYVLNGDGWDTGCFKNGRWFSLENIISVLDSVGYFD